MPTHVRRQLREAAAAAVTGLPTTGTRVHQSRMRTQGEAALPCLLVTTLDEEIEQGFQRQQERQIELVVRGLAKATASLDDTLDQIALEVEGALANNTLGGLAPAGAVLSRLRTGFDDDTDKPVGFIELEFRLRYFTQAGSPGAVV